ncbi:DUF1878 family protein [Halobacillus litoralis]|uniref:DUF1878 family protein n=1 Tax=Halobacillus litoralis TaxID=45668 RepID=UPI001CFD327B|nr:DUF1878 family protein [Halobacillus litoralis]
MKRENPCETFSFQLNLLLNVKDMQKYPFTKMVIDYNLTEKEYEETLELLDLLSCKYYEDVNDGLMDHSSLLIHYAGMLCFKMPVNESLKAMYEEGLYVDLVKILMKYI